MDESSNRDHGHVQSVQTTRLLPTPHEEWIRRRTHEQSTRRKENEKQRKTRQFNGRNKVAAIRIEIEGANEGLESRIQPSHPPPPRRNHHALRSVINDVASPLDAMRIFHKHPSRTSTWCCSIFKNVTPIVPEHPPAQLASSRQKPTNERGDGSTHCKRAVPYVLQPGLQKIMSTPWIVLRKARAKMVANSNSANRILNH